MLITFGLLSSVLNWELESLWLTIVGRVVHLFELWLNLSVELMLIFFIVLCVRRPLQGHERLLVGRERHFSATVAKLQLVVSGVITHLLNGIHHLRGEVDQLLFVAVAVPHR
jgi:hypothetical protein